MVVYLCVCVCFCMCIFLNKVNKYSTCGRQFSPQKQGAKKVREVGKSFFEEHQ